MSDGRNVSKGAYWTGWVLSVLPCLMLLMSAVMKFTKPANMSEGLEKMQWKMSYMTPLGIVELACTLLYLFPPTAYLGAILLTGYLGGAIATHVRIGDPQAANAAVLGVLIWLGLFLRDRRIRSLIPFNSKGA